MQCNAGGPNEQAYALLECFTGYPFASQQCFESGSPQDLAKACSKESVRLSCLGAHIWRAGQLQSCVSHVCHFQAFGRRERAVRRAILDVRHDSRHQFSLMHPTQPGPCHCLQRVFWLWMTPVSVAGWENGYFGVKWQCFADPSYAYLGKLQGQEGGYSAVRVLRYTPCSVTPATL